MEKYLIDYGSKTGPIRAYAPPPKGSMPTGGRRGPVKGFSPGARRRLRRGIHRLATMTPAEFCVASVWVRWMDADTLTTKSE